MISEKNKFIFIHVPGTAGTSIEYAISEAADGKLVQQGSGVWFHPKYSDAVNELKRNDSNLHISSTNMKHATANQWKHMLGDSYDEYYVFTVVRNPINKAQSLYKFNHENPVTNIRPETDWLYKQKHYVCDEHGNKIVDDIFHYESLQEDWKQICMNINVSKNLPHKNKRSMNEISFNENQIDRLTEYLKEDIVYFNYE